MFKRISHSGSTTAEYGIALALVAGLGIYGLKVLGPAIGGNLDEAAQTKGTLSVLGAVQGGAGGSGGSSAGGGSGNGAQSGGSAGGGARPPDMNMDTAEDSPATVQVSGSNGDYDKVYSSSQKLTQLAEKYKDSDPAVYDMIVKLGLQGQDVASSMMGAANNVNKQENAIETAGGGATVANASQAAEDASKNYNNQSAAYRDFWGMTVRTSADFQRMSPADQATVTQLAEESNVAMQQFTPTSNNAVSTANQVDNNNQQVENCGRGGC